MTDSLVDSLIEEAQAYAREEVWDKAFRTLTKACEFNPLDPDVLGTLGLFLVRTGQFPQAANYLEKALQRDPARVDDRMYLGAAFLFQRRNGDAEFQLRKALEYDPDHLMSAKLLVVLLAGDGRHDEARDQLERAMRRHPGDAELLTLYGKYLESDRKIADAKEAYKAALAGDPGNVEARGALLRMARERTRPPAGRRVVMMVDDRRIDRRVLDEARSLQKAGWSVTVIGGQPPDQNPYWDEECYPDLDIVRIRQIDKISIRWIDNRSVVTADLADPPVARPELEKHLERILPDPSWRGWFLSRLDFYLEAAKRPAEIYVAHDLSQLPAAAMAAHRAGAHLVYDSHELYPDQMNNQSLQQQLRSMESSVIQLADLVITVNESIAKIMSERYRLPVEVVLNCPGVDSAALPVKQGNALRDDLGIPAGTRVLLYQGGLVLKLRNLESLVSAIACTRHKDVVLVLMGPDADNSRAALSAIAQDHGLLGTRVFFHDAVKQTELLQYTASADAGIIPYPALGLLNQYYCTPNKTFEFLVAGIPILANDLPELNRFVSGQGAGMNMPMNTVEEITAAIDAFFSADLQGIRERLKVLSPAFVWETQGEKIVHLYAAVERTKAKAHRARLIDCVEEHIEKGEYEPARAQLRQLLERNGDDVSALTNQGVLEYLEGDATAALGTLRRALTLQPGAPVIVENIRVIEESLRQSA